MEFGWTKDQQQTHERMRTLGADVFAKSPDDRMAALAEGGALGLCLSEDHGGGGVDLVTTAYAFEALGQLWRIAPGREPSGVPVSRQLEHRGVGLVAGKGGDRVVEEQVTRVLKRVAPIPKHAAQIKFE